MKICPKCNTQNEDHFRFCCSCGNSLQEESEVEESIAVEIGENDTDVVDPTDIVVGEASVPKKKKTGKIAFAAIGVIAGIAILGTIGWKAMQPPPIEVTAIVFSNPNGYKMEYGERGTIPYTIEPSDATDQIITWASSDESIATVTEGGTIFSHGVGDTTITATSKNGVSTSCTLTVNSPWPDLSGMYYEYCSRTYAQLASDGSYLSIDTNPDNKDDYTDDDAIAALVQVIRALDLPESLIQKMSSTRALDGIQSQNYDGLEITWSYHPDNGLEVIFSTR